MRTEVEIYYNHTVLERLPVDEIDILEVITPGPQGPQGVPGSLGGLTIAEVPSGLINSSNMVYTTSMNFSAVWVYLNGLRMKPGVDFNVTGANAITFTYPPTTGDLLLVDYVA